MKLGAIIFMFLGLKSLKLNWGLSSLELSTTHILEKDLDFRERTSPPFPVLSSSFSLLYSPWCDDNIIVQCHRMVKRERPLFTRLTNVKLKDFGGLFDWNIMDVVRRWLHLHSFDYIYNRQNHVIPSVSILASLFINHIYFKYWPISTMYMLRER